MRRWNGWGSDSESWVLPTGVPALLQELVGPATPPQDATLDQVVRKVPRSRLPEHRLICQDPEARVRHCRGQSFPDWVALRSGELEGTFPDGVAWPRSDEEVQELLDWAQSAGMRVIPYGGGTSVLGHINPLPGDRPVLTVDLAHLCQLHHFSRRAHLATFGAGVTGPRLEEELQLRGFTLGHFPQSFELSTLGGWIATRSAGQQSIHYGRIDQLMAGATVLTPAGRWELPPFPASAAGPDLRELLLGSEGRLGIITRTTVRVSPKPELEDFQAAFFPDWVRGLAAVQDLAQARLPLSLIRLSTAEETMTNLALAGHRWLVEGLKHALTLSGVGRDRCLLLFGGSGSRAVTRTALDQAVRIVRHHRGKPLGQTLGRGWHRHRFRAPYARNSLWELGYGADTFETAVNWPGLNGLLQAIEQRLRQTAAAEGESVHVFSHLSHVYPQGSNVYTTMIFRLAPDPAATVERWRRLKRAACEAIVANQGTISHQHGIGTDHVPYLEAEKGPLGQAMLHDLCRRCDPQGVMNPGKLLPEGWTP